MFAAVLSLAVLVISTTPGASTMQYPSGIQMALQTSNALKSAVQQKSNPKRSSNQVYLQRSGRSVETKRHDDYSPYTSNPYDAGPIDMCSYPQVDVCNFPDGYTVPEYVARDATRFEDIFKNLNELLREEESWTCAKSMMNLACNHAVAPRCVSNTTVRYLGNFMEVSNRMCMSVVREPQSTRRFQTFYAPMYLHSLYPGTLSDILFQGQANLIYS